MSQSVLRPIGSPFGLVGGALDGAATLLDNAAYIAFRDDPTSEPLCALRDALPPPVRSALMATSSPPFSIIERSANLTVVGLAPTLASLAFPPAIPFAGMLSVPVTLMAEIGRFGRRMIADCGFFNALQGEAADTLTLLDFWKASNPVGGPARTALALSGGGAVNTIIDRARAPLKRLLEPVASGRAPRVSDAVQAFSLLVSLATEFAGSEDLAEFDALVNEAEGNWCRAVEQHGSRCGGTTKKSVLLPAVRTVSPVQGSTEVVDDSEGVGASALAIPLILFLMKAVAK